ncbi:MAG: CPBP family intramembrane metalloprotease [Thermoplasmatales archaeon]|nr:MAG: CPBP family intramembrane metalloprotease [Thermoplasmatales archaeon]
MDFSIKKPSHLFVLLALIVVLLIVVVFPLLSFFGMFNSLQSAQMGGIPENIRLIFEIFALLIQIVILVVLLFIGVPWLWYSLVNKLTLKEMLFRLKLRFEEIDVAFLWGIIAVIVAFGIFFLIGAASTLLGFDLTDTSNIPEIQQYFSLPSIFILLIIQPVGEEIFFRGFLLDKINLLAGKEIAIFTTAVLFGMAHLSYGNIYPALMTGVLGILFGYVVIKTKNLNAAIIAHILFNIASLTLYTVGQYLNLEALIL